MLHVPLTRQARPSTLYPCRNCGRELRKLKLWCTKEENAVCYAAHRRQNRTLATRKRRATQTLSDKEVVTHVSTVRHTDGRVETERRVHQKVHMAKVEIQTSEIVAKINTSPGDILCSPFTFAAKTTIELTTAQHWLHSMAPGHINWDDADPRFGPLVELAIPEPLATLSFFSWKTLRLFYPRLFDPLDGDMLGRLLVVRAVHREFAKGTYFPCIVDGGCQVKITSMKYDIGEQCACAILMLECDHSVHNVCIYGVDLMSLMILEDANNKKLVRATTSMLAMTVA